MNALDDSEGSLLQESADEMDDGPWDIAFEREDIDIESGAGTGPTQEPGHVAQMISGRERDTRRQDDLLQLRAVTDVSKEVEKLARKRPQRPLTAAMLRAEPAGETGFARVEGVHASHCLRACGGVVL